MQFKRVKRAISGVLLLDKPAGISSNQALQKVRWLYQAAKAGHTGNLDPIATGLLPICLGEATKFSQLLLDSDKAYAAVMKLGVTTTTGDSEGEMLETRPVAVSRPQVEQAMQRFLGEISQVPPMYSALKHQGKALYEYARKGQEIEREARQVTIHSLALDRCEGDEVAFTVRCSKGTYVRVLAEDIGRALGCGAHLVDLRRLETGDFRLDQAVTIEQLEALDLPGRDALLQPVDVLTLGFPAICLAADAAFYVRQGNAVWQAGHGETGMVRLYGPDEVFLGMGAVLEDGRIQPKRLVVKD
jgi:tRNA pseudouridine55 synthase